MRKGEMMEEDLRGRPDSKLTRGYLGTFSGVFTPSILTILGIILFLRLGYVVGNAGLGRALLIIGLANIISILTSVSLSAIATNIKVKVGGVYYIISRTLGVEFGGAIGIVLFLAQSVSVAFYCIGFAEAIMSILPERVHISLQLIAILAVSFLFVFSWLGANWATRFQYVVMGMLAVALLSFFTGGMVRWDSELLDRNWFAPIGGPDFWILFAIFFPAVTGFTQGVSMSGDLRDPGRSLPLGTFLAVGISIIIYFIVAVMFAAALPGDVLIHDYGSMKRIARVDFLIDVGVIAATLSSAMASLLGAPRILQSLAHDRIFPFLLPFAKGSGETNNPRRGVLLSAGIAFSTIGLGNLNLIASVVSMFFLISYGLLNYATFYEAQASSPSFRPRFRWFDARLSLLGWLMCLGAMLAIDLAAGLVAISVLFAIYQYLKRTAGPARWADSRRSYHLQHMREHLRAAASEPEHPRDWRPQILAFSKDSRRRYELLRFALWIEGGSGLTTAVRILEGEGVKMLKLRAEAEAEIHADILEHNLSVFPLVVFAPNLQIGIQTLIQAFGIGPLRANTIILNWFEQFPRGILGLSEPSYGRNLWAAFRLGCNIIVLDAKENEWAALEAMPPEERRIDVWWSDDATSRLMLLLAYLMTRNDEWSEARIRLLAVSCETETEQQTQELRKILEEVRIEAEPEVVKNPDTELIVEYSAHAALVFLPIRLVGNRLKISVCHDDGLEELLPRLPTVALVLAAEDIELDAEPEDGKAGEIAETLDALEDAQKKAREMKKEADESAQEAEKKWKELQDAIASGADKEMLTKLKEKATKAKAQASDAAKRAAKARAKEEDVAREVEALGVKSDEERAIEEKDTSKSK